MASTTSSQKLVNELDKAVDSAKSLLKVISDTEKVTKELADEMKDAFKGVDKKTSKGIAEFNKLLKDTNKLTEDSEKLNQSKLKTESELIKTEKLLIQALEAEEKLNQTKLKTNQLIRTQEIKEVKENERLIKQQGVANKQLEKEAKERKRVARAYVIQSKALTELRNEYKDNFVATEKNRKGLGKYIFAFTKAGRALRKQRKEVKKLDKGLKDLDNQVGENTRSVGKYEQATKKLNGVLGKLGVLALVAKGVELLTSAFGSTRKGALEMEIALSKATETAKVFINNIIKSIPFVKEAVGSLGDSFTLMGNNIKKGLIETKLLFSRVLSSDAISELQGDLKKVNDEIAILEKSSFSDSIDKITKAWDNTGSTISDSILSQEKYLRLQLKTKIAIEDQTRELAGLQEQRQILQDQSDDDTLGFVTREKFVEKARLKAIEFNEKSVALAKLKEKLTFEAVKQDLRRENALKESELAAIKTSEQLNVIIKERNLGASISDSNDEAFTAAYNERRDSEVESESFKRDQEEKFRKTARDAFEQELDILEEFTELKIASNDDIIASDKSSLEEKQKATLENINLTRSLYDDSIALIRKQGEESIDLRKDLTDQEKEAQKLLLDGLNGKKLLNETDAKALFILIRSLDLGEIEEKRLKDSIKLNKELNKTKENSLELDGKSKVDDGSFDLAVFRKEQLIAIEEDAEKQKELQIDLILFKRDKALEAEELNANEIILIKEKANQEILDLDAAFQAKLTQQQADADAKRLEARKKLLQDGIAVIDSILSKSREKQNREVDAEIDALDSRIDSVRSAINNGNSEASQSLAQLEKEKIEAEKKKEDLRKKEIRDQKIIAGLQLLSANSNDPNAVGKTLGDVSVLIAGLDSIQGFIDGTENVAASMSGHKVHNGTDGYIAKFDGREGILNPEQNAKRGSLSNDDLVDLAAMHNAGTLSGGTTVLAQNNKELVREVKEIVKAVKSIPVQSYNYDDKGKYHEQVIDSKNKRERIKVKASNIYK